MKPEDAPALRNHWWARPGWKPGRIVCTWHLTFEHAAALHRLVADYQAALTDLPGLKPVPAEWLHLTIQAVGYADEITPTDLTRVTHAVSDRVASMKPFNLAFQPVLIRGEAIVLPPIPDGPVQTLHRDIRDGIADALGPTAVRTAPEQADGFAPHVSLAYSAINAPSEPYAAALDAVATRSAVVTVDRVQLIRQDRLLAPHWQYRWNIAATAALGTDRPHLSAVAGT